MMAEQKGRGGKKPKYQIADIGGSDLTPQDISTERVLNFLIKGEVPAEQAADAAGTGFVQENPLREQTAAERNDESADTSLTSLPPSEPQGKKSLDHLFRRASASGAAAKDIKLDLRGQERPEDAAQAGEIQPVEEVRPAPSAVRAGEDSGPETQPRHPDAQEGRPTPAPPQASPATEPETRLQTAETQNLTAQVSTPEAAESAELTQLISLWKSFYRLKDGEIEALSAMYRMSHGIGSDGCYVKMRNLAEMSNLTYRYCQKVVRSLEQLGWITKLEDYDPTNKSGVLYRVNLKPSV